MEKLESLITFLGLEPSEIVGTLVLIVIFNLILSFIKRKLGGQSVHKDYTQLKDKKWLVNENRKRRKGGRARPLYPNGWFAIMDSDKLGKCVATEAVICDKELVVWRGENGVAYVADAYCPHLGAHLGVEGEVKGNCIQCPFHNWQFDGTQAGKLTCIPYSQKVIENIHLKMWKTIERSGFIWIWYDADGTEPSWEPPIFPETSSSHVLNVVDTTAYTHLQDIAENGADITHFNVLHKSVVPKKSSFFYSLLPFTILWDVDWQKGAVEDNLGHQTKIFTTARLILFGRWNLGNAVVTMTQYGPGIFVNDVVSSLGRTLIVMPYTPIGPMNTRTIHKAYCSNRAVQIAQWFFQFSHVDQLVRDIVIWNRQRSTAAPTLTKEDASIKSFRRWYSQFYGTVQSGNTVVNE